MTPLHRLALALLALVATSLAAPALAAPKGDCLWAAITEVDRTTMIEGYRTKGVNYLKEINVDPAMEAALRNRCNVAQAEAVTAGEVLGGVILEKGADVVLFEKGGIPRGSLDRAWASLPEADRETMRLFGLSAMRGEAAGANEAVPIIDRVTADLNLPSDDLNQHVFAYLMGRAIREAREAGRT